jgi:hypothetical protein
MELLTELRLKIWDMTTEGRVITVNPPVTAYRHDYIFH